MYLCSKPENLTFSVFFPFRLRIWAASVRIPRLLSQNIFLNPSYAFPLKKKNHFASPRRHAILNSLHHQNRVAVASHGNVLFSQELSDALGIVSSRVIPLLDVPVDRLAPWRERFPAYRGMRSTWLCLWTLGLDSFLEPWRTPTLPQRIRDSSPMMTLVLY